MNQRAQASLCIALFRNRYPFGPYPRPISSSFHSVSTILSRCASCFPSFPESPIPSSPTSNFYSFSTISHFNASIQFMIHHNRRKYSVDSGPDIDENKEVDMINLKFAEAREEIEMALDSKETVYFNEEAECARAAVKEVLDMYEGLLARLPESNRSAVQRSMGLKIEQLKAELKQLDD
ncbi:hypothetical protein L6164_006999 [Bauhinia variegata]|uniref:Uncharacterized protein n=1 Tax=Bauhinia variegata TaxID=167791 RepID=A0ACB9PXN7_BAUVA|nr:hypothetical protein L6164_006999 [Bauhinia variegata]